MPRKTYASDCRRRRVPTASMRPRPDAAENPEQERQAAAAVHRASMRPRPDAAENPHEGELVKHLNRLQ